MSTVGELLWPRLQGMSNRFTRSSQAEKGTAGIFLLFGLGFWLGISVMFGWFIQEFYSIEIVGPIVLRKLMELLLMSLFALLCFSNIVTSLSTFYLSDDLELLMSLPISRVSLFITRLLDGTYRAVLVNTPANRDLKSVLSVVLPSLQEGQHMHVASPRGDRTTGKRATSGYEKLWWYLRTDDTEMAERVRNSVLR